MKNLILVSGFTAAGKSYFIKKIKKNPYISSLILNKKSKSQKFIFMSYRKLKKYEKFTGKKFYFSKKTNIIFHMDIYEKKLISLKRLISQSDKVYSIVIYTLNTIFIKRILIRMFKLRKNFFFLLKKILFCLNVNNVYDLYKGWILYLKLMKIDKHFIIKSSKVSKMTKVVNYKYALSRIKKNYINQNNKIFLKIF